MRLGLANSLHSTTRLLPVFAEAIVAVKDIQSPDAGRKN
jgi:hypothetical protein